MQLWLIVLVLLSAALPSLTKPLKTEREDTQHGIQRIPGMADDMHKKVSRCVSKMNKDQQLSFWDRLKLWWKKFTKGVRKVVKKVGAFFQKIFDPKKKQEEDLENEETTKTPLEECEEVLNGTANSVTSVTEVTVPQSTGRMAETGTISNGGTSVPTLKSTAGPVHASTDSSGSVTTGSPPVTSTSSGSLTTGSGLVTTASSGSLTTGSGPVTTASSGSLTTGFVPSTVSIGSVSTVPVSSPATSVGMSTEGLQGNSKIPQNYATTKTTKPDASTITGIVNEDSKTTTETIVSIMNGFTTTDLSNHINDKVPTKKTTQNPIVIHDG